VCVCVFICVDRYKNIIKGGRVMAETNPPTFFPVPIKNARTISNKKNLQSFFSDGHNFDSCLRELNQPDLFQLVFQSLLRIP
jgi:hypothetical protein